MPPFDWKMVALGCAGGFLPDILRIIKGRYEKLPDYYKYPNFWLGLLFLVLLGGFTAWLLHASDLIQALAYGFGGPEIITKLLSEKGSAGVDRGERKFNLRQWWAT